LLVTLSGNQTSKQASIGKEKHPHHTTTTQHTMENRLVQLSTDLPTKHSGVDCCTVV